MNPRCLIVGVFMLILVKQMNRKSILNRHYIRTIFTGIDYRYYKTWLPK